MKTDSSVLTDTIKRELPYQILLVGGVLLLLVPLVWMLALSFKTTLQINTQNPLDFLPQPFTMDNFAYVLSSTNFTHFIWNSFFIAAVSTVGKLVTSLLAAYAFTQFSFKGRSFLYHLCLLSMFIPFVSTMMPNYLLLSKMGLLNTPWAVIVPHLADGMGIFLLYQTIRSIPKSIIEAARLDNMSHPDIIRKIILPVIKPSLIALGIIVFINSWNEYFWPLLVISDKAEYTLPLTLNMFSNVEGGTEWGAVMAAATLTALPPMVFYMMAQKYIVETFLHSGVKG